MIEIRMSNEEKTQVHISAVRTKPDGTTVPAKIDGLITYVVTAGDATVDSTENADPFFVSGESAMESTITATADADLGEGITHIVQEFSVIVSAVQATGFGVLVDTPIAK